MCTHGTECETIIETHPCNFLPPPPLLISLCSYRCRECGSARYALSQVADLYTANLARYEYHGLVTVCF